LKTCDWHVAKINGTGIHVHLHINLVNLSAAKCKGFVVNFSDSPWFLSFIIRDSVSGNVTGKRFHLLQWMLLFRVCISVTFMHCAQTAKGIDMISPAYNSPMSLPDHVTIWLTSVNLFYPNFAPK